MGNCENFVGKREELVFDAFIDSEPVSNKSSASAEISDRVGHYSYEDMSERRVWHCVTADGDGKSML